MAKTGKYKVVSEFQGYRNKRDITNLEAGVLVTGSQNVISTDGDRIAVREGYTLFGDASTAETPIRSSYEWQTHRGVEIPLRRYDDELEVYYNSDWYRIKDSLSTTAISQFTTVWDDTEKQDFLLFVDGDSNIYDWSGGMAIFASATVNTVTLNTTATGFSTWAEAGFLTTGTRTIVIGGVSATYTGGESTDTLTGVSVDFSATAAGTPVFQAVRTNSNKPASNLKSNLIATLNNQVYVGQTTSRVVYVSKNSSFTDFAFSSPRLPGEGALLTLDQTPTGFVPQEDAIYFSTKDFWYQTVLQLSADLVNESLTVKRLKTAAQKGAKSQGYISNDGNRVIFVSNEPTYDQLGRVENINTPENKPLSDPIKTDFDNYEFSATAGHTIRHRNYQYISIPAENLVLMYNLEKQYWEAPQVLPIGRFSIIGGLLYGHSSQVAETYLLFDGTNDNGNSISAKAKFSYMNYGDRAQKKALSEWFTEGYISANTTLNLKLYYDYEGYTSTKEYEISGNDESILFQSTDDNSLGQDSLGDESLGGGGGEETLLPPKFRHIQGIVKQDFYEIQVEYSTDSVDQTWELLAFGADTSLSTNNNNEITK